MKKITAILLIVLFVFLSCKKNGVEALVEDDLPLMVKDTSKWVVNPQPTEEELNSFRRFSSIDEISVPGLFFINGPLGLKYEIPNLPPVKSQYDKPSCGAFAACYYALSYHHAVRMNDFNYKNSNTFSPDFIYNTSVEDKLIKCGEGNSFLHLRDILINKGTCTISSLAIDTHKENEVCTKLNPVTQIQKDEAYKYRVKDLLFYVKNSSGTQFISDFKSLLSNNIPIVIVMPIDQVFKNLGIGLFNYDYLWRGKSGNWVKDNDEKKSNHWMTVVGYDDDQNAFKIINSWGKQWGDNGFAYIDYNLMWQYIKAAFIIKYGSENITEQTGVTFYNNYHEAVCVGGGANTGVFGGNMSGVNVVNWSGLNIARFTQQNHSRIEYNLNNTIPGYPDQINQEGTFEMTANIQNAYLYNNYQLENDSIATLFTTDNSGADVNWPGSMRLLASKSGTIQFVINTQKYGNAPNILEAKNTHFRFKQWHRIGISYGSQGMHIMLDGKIVASNVNFKQKIANGGGHSLQNDRPTIGEAKSYFPWGNYQYGRGFEGYLYKVRSSALQSDFKLSL